MVFYIHEIEMKFSHFALDSEVARPGSSQLNRELLGRFQTKSLIPETNQSHIEATLSCALFELRLRKVL